MWECSAVDNIHHQIQVWSFSWSSQQTSEQRKRKVISLTQIWPWCDGVFCENRGSPGIFHSLQSRRRTVWKTKTREQWAAAPWTEILRWWEGSEENGLTESLWQLAGNRSSQLLRADRHQSEKQHRQLQVCITWITLKTFRTFLNYACFSIWLLHELSDWRGQLATLVLSLIVNAWNPLLDLRSPDSRDRGLHLIFRVWNACMVNSTWMTLKSTKNKKVLPFDRTEDYLLTSPFAPKPCTPVLSLTITSSCGLGPAYSICPLCVSMAGNTPCPW